MLHWDNGFLKYEWRSRSAVLSNTRIRRLTAGSSHGEKPDDGSHLTGDGPGFIKKMREEGIVCREDNYDDPRDYEFE